MKDLWKFMQHHRGWAAVISLIIVPSLLISFGALTGLFAGFPGWLLLALALISVIVVDMLLDYNDPMWDGWRDDE